MNNARRYANVLKMFFCCFFYMPLCPWLSLVGFVGILMQYAADKYLLLRWYRRPDKPANSNMSMFSLRAVKLVAPWGLTVAALVFLCPSMRDKASSWGNFYMCAFFAFCTSYLLPFRVWARIL